MKTAKTAVLMLLFALLLAIPASAKDKDRGAEDSRAYKLFQGVVGAYDGATMTLNENTIVVITSDTKFYDSSSRETSKFGIRVGKWVYVEGPIREDKTVEAEKVYILPGYIGKSSRSRYPFIQAP